MSPKKYKTYSLRRYYPHQVKGSEPLLGFSQQIRSPVCRHFTIKQLGFQAKSRQSFLPRASPHIKFFLYPRSNIHLFDTNIYPLQKRSQCLYF